MFSVKGQLLQKVFIADCEPISREALGLEFRLPLRCGSLAVWQVDPSRATVLVCPWPGRLDPITPTGAGRVNHAPTGPAAGWAGEVASGFAAISPFRFQLKPASEDARPSLSWRLERAAVLQKMAMPKAV